MKKLLLILFCLFVTFEVKSKDVILECDGIEIKNIYYSNENVINDVVQTSKKEVFLLNKEIGYLFDETRFSKPVPKCKNLYSFQISETKILSNKNRQDFMDRRYGDLKIGSDPDSNRNCKPHKNGGDDYSVLLNRITLGIDYVIFRYHVEPDVVQSEFKGKCKISKPKI